MNIHFNSQKIKIIREELGFSQTDFSKELSIPQPYLSAMEAGKKSISVKLCFQLHTQFNVNMNWFFTGSGTTGIFNSAIEGIDTNNSSNLTVDLSSEKNPLNKKKVNITLWV